MTKHLFAQTSGWRSLPLLGIAATLADWAENTGVYFILQTLETPIGWLDALTRALILLKTVVGILCLGLIFIFLIVLLLRRLAASRKQTTAS